MDWNTVQYRGIDNTLNTINVDNPYEKLNVDTPSYGGWDVFNSIFRRTDPKNLSVSDWAGGVGTTTKGAATNYAGKIGGFLSNPITQLGIVGLEGGYAAFHQAKDERDAIKAQNKALRTSITGLQNTEQNVINRGQGSANSLLYQYATSTNPNMQQGYSSMYGQNVGSTNQTVDSINQNISKLRSMIQGVPSKDSMWSAAFTGALGGIFGVGDMQRAYSTKKYYDKQYETYYG